MTLHRIMPAKAAFVLATSLRFIPLLQKELRSIYEAQLLRGARISPKDLRHLGGWKDLVHCLLVPFIVQIFKMTGEIALAAQVRNFDVSIKRTFWPGD
jgi:energy-coupling factor transport system permease protein